MASTDPMTPAQGSYLMKLIMQAFQNDPKARRIALDNMATLKTRSAASSAIDAMKGLTEAASQKTAAQKMADAVAAVNVVLPTKGAKLLVNGVVYLVKNHKWKNQISVYVENQWGDSSYFATLGMGKTAAIESVLASPAQYEASAVAYAGATEKCSFCHTPLKDPVSIAQGYGPVCKKKYVSV